MQITTEKLREILENIEPNYVKVTESDSYNASGSYEGTVFSKGDTLNWHLDFDASVKVDKSPEVISSVEKSDAGHYCLYDPQSFCLELFYEDTEVELSDYQKKWLDKHLFDFIEISPE